VPKIDVTDQNIMGGNYANIKGIRVITLQSALPKALLFHTIRKGLATHKHKQMEQT